MEEIQNSQTNAIKKGTTLQVYFQWERKMTDATVLQMLHNKILYQIKHSNNITQWEIKENLRETHEKVSKVNSNWQPQIGQQVFFLWDNELFPCTVINVLRSDFMLVSFKNSDSFDTFILLGDKQAYNENSIQPPEDDIFQQPTKKKKVEDDQVIVLDSDDEAPNNTVQSPNSSQTGQVSLIESVPDIDIDTDTSDSPEPPKAFLSPHVRENGTAVRRPRGRPKGSKQTLPRVAESNTTTTTSYANSPSSSPKLQNQQTSIPNQFSLKDDNVNITSTINSESKEHQVRVIGGKPAIGKPEFYVQWLNGDKQGEKEWITLEELKKLDPEALLDFFLDHLLFETKKRKREF